MLNSYRGTLKTIMRLRFQFEKRTYYQCMFNFVYFATQIQGDTDRVLCLHKVYEFKIIPSIVPRNLSVSLNILNVEQSNKILAQLKDNSSSRFTSQILTFVYKLCNDNKLILNKLRYCKNYFQNDYTTQTGSSPYNRQLYNIQLMYTKDSIGTGPTDTCMYSIWTAHYKSMISA